HGLRRWLSVAEWLTRQTGILTMMPSNIHAFVKSREGLAEPDLQILLQPGSMDRDYIMRTGIVELESVPGMTISAYQLRPESRGSIHTKSPDPMTDPAIICNYLADPMDREVTLAGLRICRSIAAQPSIRSFVVDETTPGPATKSDDELL